MTDETRDELHEKLKETAELHESLRETMREAARSADGVLAAKAKLGIDIMPMWLALVHKLGAETMERFIAASGDTDVIDEYLTGLTELTCEMAVVGIVATIPIEHLGEEGIEAYSDTVRSRFEASLRRAIEHVEEEKRLQ